MFHLYFSALFSALISRADAISFLRLAPAESALEEYDARMSGGV
jgi:hypothetical protein